MSKKIEAFVRIECDSSKETKHGNKIKCNRWLGDIDTITKGTTARFWCRDCKTIHIVSVLGRGIIKREHAPEHANLEYDISMAVVS